MSKVSLERLSVASGIDVSVPFPSEPYGNDEGIYADLLKSASITLRRIGASAVPNSTAISVFLDYNSFVEVGVTSYSLDAIGTQTDGTGNVADFTEVGAGLVKAYTSKFQVLSITAANPAVITVGSTSGLSVGDYITIGGVGEDSSGASADLNSYNTQYSIVSISGNEITTGTDASTGFRPILVDGYDTASIVKLYTIAPETGVATKSVALPNTPYWALTIPSGSTLHGLLVPGGEYILRIEFADDFAERGTLLK